MAKAILAARPDSPASRPMSSCCSRSSSPRSTDISIDDMIDKIRQALGTKGKLPCTLIVLDEVQQYIGDERWTVQGRAGPEGAVLLPAGGQLPVRRHRPERPVRHARCCNGSRALPGHGRACRTPTWSKSPAKSSSRRSPRRKRTLKKLLEDHSGEIERQLASTKIAFTTRDRGLLVQDYPILPVRRRFWERVLRAVDKAGTGAQLRTQLWIVYDAVKQTADLPLGNVVSGAFLYEHIKTRCSSRASCFRKSPKPSPSRSRKTTANFATSFVRLIFLIGQLPHQGPADAGHPGRRRYACRPARHRPDQEQRRAPQEGPGSAGEAGRLRGDHAGR